MQTSREALEALALGRRENPRGGGPQKAKKAIKKNLKN
jgi:hypothetical protein